MTLTVHAVHVIPAPVTQVVNGEGYPQPEVPGEAIEPRPRNRDRDPVNEKAMRSIQHALSPHTHGSLLFDKLRSRPTARPGRLANCSQICLRGFLARYSSVPDNLSSASRVECRPRPTIRSGRQTATLLAGRPKPGATYRIS